MKTELPIDSGDIVLDKDGRKLDTVTAAMDNFLELTTVAFLIKNGDQNDKISASLSATIERYRTVLQ